MMDWNWIATVVMVMVVVATVGGVVLLFPVSRRLGALLEAMTKERQDAPDVRPALHRLGTSIETLEERLDLLEEKQDFTERLLRERNRKRVEGGGRGTTEEDSTKEPAGTSG